MPDSNNLLFIENRENSKHISYDGRKYIGRTLIYVYDDGCCSFNYKQD